MLKEIGFNVEEKASPVKFNDLLDLHWEMLIYETGKNLQFLLNHPEELIGPRLLQIIKDGLNINIEKYIETKSKLNRSINKFFSSFNKNTIFIFPAIPIQPFRSRKYRRAKIYCSMDSFIRTYCKLFNWIR